MALAGLQRLDGGLAEPLADPFRALARPARWKPKTVGRAVTLCVRDVPLGQPSTEILSWASPEEAAEAARGLFDRPCGPGCTRSCSPTRTAYTYGRCPATRRHRPEPRRWLSATRVSSTATRRWRPPRRGGPSRPSSTNR